MLKLISERIPTVSHTATPYLNTVIDLSSPPGLIFHWAWRRDIRTAHELEELNNLINLLAQSHLSEQPDSWECTLNNSRSFTVQVATDFEDNKGMFGLGLRTRSDKYALMPNKSSGILD
ncbi:hypothetical protein CTI12_AA356850 [Artemisia annua]|uniref:Uncharacterized protein n=1 Tax=Artemisia annua TaxID=35608 RepID=A0A2U1MPL9_ARTAN|nr:hypothetical protein CTI12_AA356850 [Artemisia annua]